MILLTYFILKEYFWILVHTKEISKRDFLCEIILIIIQNIFRIGTNWFGMIHVGLEWILIRYFHQGYRYYEFISVRK